MRTHMSLQSAILVPNWLQSIKSLLQTGQDSLQSSPSSFQLLYQLFYLSIILADYLPQPVVGYEEQGQNTPLLVIILIVYIVLTKGDNTHEKFHNWITHYTQYYIYSIKLSFDIYTSRGSNTADHHYQGVTRPYILADYSP